MDANGSNPSGPEDTGVRRRSWDHGDVFLGFVAGTAFGIGVAALVGGLLA